MQIKESEGDEMRPIKEGDIVNVYWCDEEKSELKGLKVLHVPCNVGDMWYFEDKQGSIFAQNPIAQTLDTIVKPLSAQPKTPQTKGG